MRVIKSTDDLAVQLPAEIIKQLGLQEGDDVDLKVEGGSLTIVASRQVALTALRSLAWTLPEGFKFNRDEANER